jgi:hypothetical protein
MLMSVRDFANCRRKTEYKMRLEDETAGNSISGKRLQMGLDT